MSKEKQINVRLLNQEAEILSELAKKSNESLSAYIRKLIFKEEKLQNEYDFLIDKYLKIIFVMDIYEGKYIKIFSELADFKKISGRILTILENNFNKEIKSE